MSAFTNGFNIGFDRRIFNGMFGGFAPFGGCNFFDNYRTSVFTPYSSPSINMPLPNSFMPAMDNPFDWSNCNFNNSNPWGTFSVGDSFSCNSRTRNYSDLDTSNFTYDAEALKNKWQKKKPHLTQGFYNKVVQVAKRVNCSPDDLMGLMNSESGIKANAVNKSSGATGLIQFMPETAEAYGTSCPALKSMSAEEQLVYVEKYLLSSKKAAKLGNQRIGPGTLYALVFLPAYANQDVLCRKGDKYYRANTGLDLDKDGIISKNDLANRVRLKA